VVTLFFFEMKLSLEFYLEVDGAARGFAAQKEQLG
jgi:hypothetical protein